MQGLQIFIHSVRQVFGNFGAALRISGLLTLVQIALVFVLGLQVVLSPDGGQAMMMAGTYPTGRVALYAVLSIIISLWIAVAWHRYVLREEDSGGVIPAWHGGRVWAYFVKGFLIFLTTFGMGLVVGLIAGIISGITGAGMFNGGGATGETAVVAGLIFAAVIGSAAIYVFYRLSPALPAAALGEPLGLGDAWRKMAGKGGTIFVLALISIIVAVVVGQGPTYLLGLQGLPAVIWAVVAQWFNLMVGISIMTTLYGHYVEGRALV
jgi:hypothetical protein